MPIPILTYSRKCSETGSIIYGDRKCKKTQRSRSRNQEKKNIVQYEKLINSAHYKITKNNVE